MNYILRELNCHHQIINKINILFAFLIKVRYYVKKIRKGDFYGVQRQHEILANGKKT